MRIRSRSAAMFKIIRISVALISAWSIRLGMCGPLGEPAAGDLLDSALGYAAVYHVEKAENLCNQALETTSDSALSARAHWIKAAAYAHYQVEYRSEKYKEKLAAEKDLVRRLQPDLLARDLARLEILLAFHRPGAPLPQTVLEQMRRQLLAAESKNPATAAETQLSDPVHIYQMAHAYLTAARLLPEGRETERNSFCEHAERLFQKAAQMKPDCYEFAAYHLTALGTTERTDEALRLAQDILARFDGKVPFPPLGDRGPACLYAATLAMSDAKQAEQWLDERVRRPAADAWVHYEVTVARANDATSPTQQVRLWEDLLARMEAGEIPTPGTYLHAKASALYKLAHYQSREAAARTDPAQSRRGWENALATCDRLMQLSPHYAEVHYNRGIVLNVLAELADEPERSKTYRDAARKEFRLQMEHDWQGTAARAARAKLDAMPN
ncbi:MAG: hypothetical protein N3D11_07090 [Candidatus Sumerlaeia bacterium]|nr:hypothetical protein [Candidatus Sumerlaeia bacterium]